VWQRCRTHFTRNLLTRVPKSAQDFVAALVRSIFAQPDRAAVLAQHARVVTQISERFSEASDMLADATHDVLAFATFPKEHWRQIWSNNPQERLNREIRRRTTWLASSPPRCGHPSRRRGARGAARRVGRGAPLQGSAYCVSGISAQLRA